VAPVTLTGAFAATVGQLALGRRVAVASYLLAEGFFYDSAVRDAALAGDGVPVTPPLGAHPAVVDLVVARYLEAAGRPVPVG
jgi:sirohydrochlorin ferrochelatase